MVIVGHSLSFSMFFFQVATPAKALGLEDDYELCDYLQDWAVHKESSAIIGYISCQGIPVNWVDSFWITPAFVAVAFDIVSTMHLSPAHQTVNLDNVSCSFSYDIWYRRAILGFSVRSFRSLCIDRYICIMTCWDRLAGLKNECWFDGLVQVETVWNTAWCTRNAMIARIACFRGSLGSAGGWTGWQRHSETVFLDDTEGMQGCEGSSKSYFLIGTVCVKYDHSLRNVITYILWSGVYEFWICALEPPRQSKPIALLHL